MSQFRYLLRTWVMSPPQGKLTAVDYLLGLAVISVFTVIGYLCVIGWIQL